MKRSFNILILIVISTAVYFLLYLPANVDRSAPGGPAGSREIRVIDNEDGRVLLIDGQMKGYVDTLRWESYLRYVAVLDLPMHFAITPGTMFLAGIGTGSVIKNYKRAGWSVEVAEPDSSMVATAKKSFGVDSEDAIILPYDGYRALAEITKDSYDIILVDAINCGGYPVTMMTKEFFALTSSRLKDGGIVAISLESLGWHDEIVYALSATLKQSFKEVFVFPIVEPPNVFGSIVLFASNSTHGDFVRDPERNENFDPNWRYGPEYQKIHAWDNHFVADDKNAEIFTRGGSNSITRLALRLRHIAGQQKRDYLP